MQRKGFYGKILWFNNASVVFLLSREKGRVREENATEDLQLFALQDNRAFRVEGISVCVCASLCVSIHFDNNENNLDLILFLIRSLKSKKR